MLKFGGINGYDQLVISKAQAGTTGETNKWSKQRREFFQVDIPKILVTQRHIFAAHLNSIIVLDTKPLCDAGEAVYVSRKDFKLDIHASAITCFGVEEKSLLLCSCSDEHVFLSKWDSILGHWDTKGISEDDGRILSCSITYKGLAIYITLFKSDTLIVYKIISPHPPTEPGPLILDSIECLATLEKVKEMTSWSKSVFYKDNFYLIGIASGNTVSLKLWEVLCENGQYLIKLKSHRMVSNFKHTVGADVAIERNNIFILIVGNDGSSEVFSFTGDTFDLLYRFKIEESADPTSTSNAVQSTLNTSLSALHIESRILCAKFFLVHFPDPVQFLENSSPVRDIDGGGDAKPFALLNPHNDELGTSENAATTLCPKLIIAAATTKGVRLINAISGRIEMYVSHGELIKDESIFIQNAQMAANPDSLEIVIGLQPCLTRIVFSRRFLVNFTPLYSEESQTYPSLIPTETLSSKSVLRKKIKSPPRQPPSYPIIRRNKSKVYSRSPINQPSWARSRSRPQIRSSISKGKSNIPATARSQSSVSSNGSRTLVNSDSESLTARVVKISATGSYENEHLSFQSCEKVIMPSSISHGISILRIAGTSSGKYLAFGSNFTPLLVTKTQPFQSYRIFKDVGKVTNVNFNFTGNILLVGSSGCRTTLIDWQNSKEILSFEFNSKFNEHVHTQFYFMDKFILQPEENKLALYSYAKRETNYIKLKAGEFQLSGQAITALGAANQFYSNLVLTGLSNKTIQIFDTNAEMISTTILNTHSKPVSCIRINEAPKGRYATSLCDVFMTSSFSNWDPIKLWDIRSAQCIMRISDINQATFVPTSRPNISPCGRYIVSGLEDCSLSFYDIRRVKSRIATIKKLGSTVLDCCFDSNLPMVWGGCRNGSILNFHIP